MTRNETTNERPTDYSSWHRKLPSFCTAQDIDWIEYRTINDEVIPAAIIETGRWKRTRFKDNQIKIILRIIIVIQIVTAVSI